MSTQEGERGIRTSNLRFMRRGLQPIELPLGDNNELSITSMLRFKKRIKKLLGRKVNLLTLYGMPSKLNF
jgi:hypothetical protein